MGLVEEGGRRNQDSPRGICKRGGEGEGEGEGECIALPKSKFTCIYVCMYVCMCIVSMYISIYVYT